MVFPVQQSRLIPFLNLKLRAITYPHPLIYNASQLAYTIVMDHRKLSSLGGKARMKKLTKKQRSELASKAAKARWKKYRDNQLLIRT